MYFPDKKVLWESKLMLKSELLLYYVTGFVIIYLLPKNILSDNKFIGYICERASSFIPAISKWSFFSPFPEVTKFYFTYCWISIPFQAISIIKYKKAEMDFVNKWNENKKLNILRLVVLVMLVGLFIYFSANYAIIDVKPCFVCVNSSRFSQALIGGLIPFVNAGMLALVYWLVKNYKKIF